MDYEQRIRELCDFVYENKADTATRLVLDTISRHKPGLEAAAALLPPGGAVRRPGNCDSFLITYGNSIQGQADTTCLPYLDQFLDAQAKGIFSFVHILPFFPWSSDDGFSVIDYSAVDPAVGSWQDVARLSAHSKLAFDLVLNHASSQGAWFKEFLAGNPAYDNWFITRPDGYDWSKVVRPRTHPLFSPYSKKDGSTVQVWTTFSADQVDLNFENPQVLAAMLDIFLDYIEKGARIIRLDAIAYLWKEDGHSCLHHPKTHAIVKLFRAVVDLLAADCLILTETNVPHADNIAYFGNGSDEAHMVYNFALPPLVLHSFVSGKATELSIWAAKLAAPGSGSFLNFLASHDGIGVTPVAGLVEAAAFEASLAELQRRGGLISYKATSAGNIPYELNISWFDAVSDPALPAETRVAAHLASYAIASVLDGLPAVYIHSLLGSPNWTEGPKLRGYNRAINRRQLQSEEIAEKLADPVSVMAQTLSGFKRLFRARTAQAALNASSGSRIIDLAPSVFALLRGAKDNSLLCLTNVSAVPVSVQLKATQGIKQVGAPIWPLLDETAPATPEFMGKVGETTKLLLPAYAVCWLPCTQTS